MINLLLGDCLNKLQEIEDNSIDSIVTDPPYGLAFMGKKWDYDVPSVEIWKECLRVLKPGGHLLSFGGTRTYHRMVINIEDAGFEVRDQIMWIYGSGFPKSMDISKAIDKQAGAKREVIGKVAFPRSSINATNALGGSFQESPDLTAPATDSAKQWQGWGTALKPANEPICLARKPISEKTVASNVLKHGTGAMNIDESRIDGQPRNPGFKNPKESNREMMATSNTKLVGYESPQGRWPANVIFDEEAGKILDKQSGNLGKSSGGNSRNVSNKIYGSYKDELDKIPCGFGDSGGASRFFYCAKTSKTERNAGLEGMDKKDAPGSKRSAPAEGRSSALGAPRENFHPTVKPIKLMAYLIKLVTPAGGLVLDPFMGSGSTGVAAIKNNFKFTGIERDSDYFNIAKSRIENGDS